MFIGLAARCSAAIDHVVLISVDGLRGDLLRTMVETAPQEVPAFVWLRDHGAASYNARCCATWGYTNGNHISMVTSRPALQPAGFPDTVHHGYTENGYVPGDNIQNAGNPAVPYKAGIFDVVHDRGLSTGAYFFKEKLKLIADSYDATFGSPDLIGADNGRNKIDDFPLPDETPKTPYLVAAIDAGEFKNFSMLHIAEPDYAGHGSGWTVDPGAPYREALHVADNQIGAVLQAILAKPAYADHTAIIIVADHGGGESDFYSHGDVTKLGDVTIPFFLWAPGIAGGTDAHSWFENRFDPGATIPGYELPHQPLRNVDAGNLAAELLGLPPIPNSFVRPAIRRPLKIARQNNTIELRWPVYLTGEKLEFTDDLSLGQWTPVPGPVSESAGEWHYSETLTGSRRFFHLWSP
ncbi:MAG: alkaline phosphatase [Verrucomicrobiota bacterium]